MAKTVILTKPLTYGNNKIMELSFRRPSAGDLRGLKLSGLSEMDVDLILKLSARTSTTVVTEAQLYELDPADFIAVATEIVGFFGDAAPSPTTHPAPGES